MPKARQPAKSRETKNKKADLVEVNTKTAKTNARLPSGSESSYSGLPELIRPPPPPQNSLLSSVVASNPFDDHLPHPPPHQQLARFENINHPSQSPFDSSTLHPRSPFDNPALVPHSPYDSPNLQPRSPFDGPLSQPRLQLIPSPGVDPGQPGIGSPLAYQQRPYLHPAASMHQKQMSMGMGPMPGPPNSGGKMYPPNQPMVFNSANPNAPPIYPCGVCHKEVHDNDQAILCESGCNFWFHRTCTGLSEPAYTMLTQEVYAEWVCDKCLQHKNIPLIKMKP